MGSETGSVKIDGTGQWQGSEDPAKRLRPATGYTRVAFVGFERMGLIIQDTEREGSVFVGGQQYPEAVFEVTLPFPDHLERHPQMNRVTGTIKVTLTQKENDTLSCLILGVQDRLFTLLKDQWKSSAPTTQE